MVVIVLEKCPISLRGDLTKWLQEISLGVYVGHVSARVRDSLWVRVCSECKSGRATMVFSARNEQRYECRVHNTAWEPIDFDGLKLMLRPSLGRQREKSDGRSASGLLARRRVGGRSRGGHRPKVPAAYVVVDVETTGLDPEADSIVELAAVKVINGREESVLHSFVAAGDNGDLQLGNGETKKIEEVISDFVYFVGSLPLVFHNAAFDMAFIDAALEDAEFDELDNPQIDTLELSKKVLPDVRSHKLEDLAEMFEIEHDLPHRALCDCRATGALLLKLIEL